MQSPFSLCRHFVCLLLVTACSCFIIGCGSDEPDKKPADRSAADDGTAGGANQTTQDGAASPDTPAVSENSTAQQAPASPASGTPGSVPAGQPMTPEEEIHAAIDDALAKLKAGDLRGFFENYAPVEEVKRMKANPAQFEQMLEEVRNNPAQLKQTIEALDRMRQGKPEFEDDGTRAILREHDELAGATNPNAAAAYSGELTNPKIWSEFQDLPSTIETALAMLEDGELNQFVSSMFPVTALRHPEADRQVEQMTARLKTNPAAVEQMIADFRAMQDIAPKMQKSDTVAVYELPGETVGEGEKAITTPVRMVRLQQVDGAWRLYDNSQAAHEELVRQSKLPVPAFEGGVLGRLVKVDGKWRILSFGR